MSTIHHQSTTRRNWQSNKMACHPTPQNHKIIFTLHRPTEPWAAVARWCARGGGAAMDALTDVCALPRRSAPPSSRSSVVPLVEYKSRCSGTWYLSRSSTYTTTVDPTVAALTEDPAWRCPRSSLEWPLSRWAMIGQRPGVSFLESDGGGSGQQKPRWGP
jgi:hypothetical protein